MTIEVDVSLRRGGFSLDVAFAAGAGLTALFGRSGSGKTTVIDLIAGLVRPDRGRIAVAGETLLDTARGLVVPVHRRRIGYVFQGAHLMPHLSVRQNLGFGRWFARRRSGAEGGFDAVVALLGIEALLERRPAGLSGGETQRVAIGRALLSRPRLLLMDEPLAALDEARKHEILPYIERLRDETVVPIVYVSHAVAEVARLANTVVVLETGRVVASGTADEVLRRPDLMPGTAEASALLEMSVEAHDEAAGLTRLAGTAGNLAVPHLALGPGSPVRVRVPARDVLVATARPIGLSARNILPGRVRSLMPLPEAAVMVEIDCNGALLVARLNRASVRELGLEPGLPVFAIVKSVAFDPQDVGTGRRAPVEI